MRAVVFLTFLMASNSIHAQILDRWFLGFSDERPQFFTHNNKKYMYYVFEIKNTLQYTHAPLMMDISAYVEQGKSMVDDKSKLDVDIIKKINESKDKDPRDYQKYLLGRYYTAVIAPEVEYRLIEHITKLSNRTSDVIKESIEEFKKNGFYLSLSEIRKRKFLKPGEKIRGLAIFPIIDEDAKYLEVHISGLHDFVKVIKITELDVQMEYENKILKIVYEFDTIRSSKDEDFMRFKRRETITKRIGPIGSKDTLEKLLSSLFEMLRKEKKLVEAFCKEKKKEYNKLSVDELMQLKDTIEIFEKSENLTTLDFNISARIFKLATDLDYGYDTTKTLLDNESVVWKIHEFWINNKHKLIFDDLANQFVIREIK